jgi:hypothetical protein
MNFSTVGDINFSQKDIDFIERLVYSKKIKGVYRTEKIGKRP